MEHFSQASDASDCSKTRSRGSASSSNRALYRRGAAQHLASEEHKKQAPESEWRRSDPTEVGERRSSRRAAAAMPARLLSALLVLQCLRHAAACSGHSQRSYAATFISDNRSPLQWDDLQQRHQRRHLRQSNSAAAVTVKYLKRRECASQEPGAATQQSVQRRLEPHVVQIEAMAANQRLAATPITIDVHFHLLRAIELIT